MEGLNRKNVLHFAICILTAFIYDVERMQLARKIDMFLIKTPLFENLLRKPIEKNKNVLNFLYETGYIPYMYPDIQARN